MRVVIERLRPEVDDYRESLAEPHFKRTRAWGEARAGDSVERFVVVLDIRARLLSVQGEAHHTLAEERAKAIGTAIVNEMGLFVSRPIGHLLQPVLGSGRAEWTVDDADHVNGLLHRLREQKTFEARAAPPVPRRLLEITDDLTRAAIENMRQVNLTWNSSGHLATSFVPTLDLSAWEANRDRFLDWTEDHATREAFARIFERFRAYSALWSLGIQVSPRATDAPDGVAVTVDRAAAVIGWSATHRARRLKNELERDLNEVVARIGTEAHARQLSDAMNAQSDM